MIKERGFLNFLKKHPQQLATTALLSAGLFFALSKREETLPCDVDNKIGNALASIFLSLSSQLFNNFYLLAGAVLSTVVESGKFPGAAAQQIPVTVQYPYFEIGSTDIPKSDDVVLNKNATLFYLINTNDYCFEIINIKNILHPGPIVGAYGKKTTITNHCRKFILDKQENLAFIANANNNGLSIVNVSNSTAPTFVANLPGFNARSVALSQDEETAFLAGYLAQSGPRIFSIDISNPRNPRLISVTSFPWMLPVSTSYTVTEEGSTFMMQTKRDGSIVFAYGVWPPSDTNPSAPRGVESAVCIIDVNVNASLLNLIRKGCVSWTGQLPAFGYPATAISGFSFSEDESRIFLSASNKLPPSRHLNSPQITGPRYAVSIIDISNASSLKTLRTYLSPPSNGTNQAAFFSDEKLAVIADYDGVNVVNFDQLIPTDSPFVIAKWKMENGAIDITLSPNKKLVIVRSANTLKIMLLRQTIDMPLDAVVTIPVLPAQLTEDYPVLKTGEDNTGKLFFFQNKTANQTTPVIQNVTMNGQALPDWFSFNQTNYEFNAIPPENMMGQTLTLHFNLGNRTGDVSFPIVHGSGLTLSPTTATPRSTSALPRPTPTFEPTIEPTFKPTVVPTIVPTAAPTPIPTPIPTPGATDPIQDITFPPNLAPEETFSPASQSNNLQLITTGEKIQLNSNANSLTLKIKLPKPRIGQFMLTASNLGSVFLTMSESLGILTAVGNPAELNQMLQNLRFSLDDQAYNQSQILLAVSQDGESAWTLGLGNLNQLGINRAPVLKNNATDSNQTAALNEPFLVALDVNFEDPDGDPISYKTLSNGKTLPPWIHQRNNVLSGTSSLPINLTMSVTATDGYKESVDRFTFSVTYQYFPPVLLNNIPSQTIKVGQGFIYSIPLNTFRNGNELQYIATLENGYPLPQGLSFDPNRLQLSGTINQDTQYRITITAYDRFRSSANVTFTLNAFDHPPVVKNVIPTQIAKAGKTFSSKIPIDTFFDLDDASLTYSVTQANGAPLPSWINFDPDTRQIIVTPNAEMFGKNIELRVRASDGYKFADTNFTVFVPPNQPPVVKERLPNVTATTGTELTYRIPSGSFASPENFTLTYLANLLDEASKKNIPIPEWIKLDGNILFGTPGKNDVGDVWIKITAIDPLNDKASQAFRIEVQLSLWDKMQYWLLRVGVPISAVITMYSVYEYYEKRSIVMNTLTGKRYLLKKPFDAYNELQVECPKNLTLYPEYLQRIQPHELDILNRTLTVLVWPFRYLRERHTLIPVEKPDWIRFNDATNTLKVYPDEIPNSAKTVIVQLRTASGRIRWQTEVNPSDFYDDDATTVVDNISPPPSNELEQELLKVPVQQFNPLGSNQYRLFIAAQPLPTNANRNRVMQGIYSV